jgi:hypothetical protein
MVGRWVAGLALAALIVAGVAPAAKAAATDAFELDYARLVADAGDPDNMLLAQADAEEPITEPAEAAESEGGCPFGVGLTYALYSDYIFRFVNFSEYPGEGREKPNHQLTTDFSYDLGDFGTVGFTAWFEWYAAQAQLNGSSDNTQEIDYTIYWSYGLDAMATDLTLGVSWYTFPNDKAINSFEYFISLEHNDAWMWQALFPDNEDGVLNPSFLFVHDVDEQDGIWMEFAINHPFEVFENFTVTPGWMVAVDHRYWADTTRFAGDQWSLVLEYDVGALLQLPESVGSLTVAGELYWNNPWGTLEDDGTAQDVLWGGMSVAWAWGG